MGYNSVLRRALSGERRVRVGPRAGRSRAPAKVAAALLAFAFATLPLPAQTASRTGEAASRQIPPQWFSGLHWRSIGPAVFGGRVTDIAGVPGDPYLFYVAHSTAGLFKTTDGGITFHSIFNDGNTLSIGAIALSPDNPAVIYVGTGEGNPRNSASFGDGIYKSFDGGRTWKHLGLTETERFSRILVNPLYPRIVFAAAMGHEWGPNRQRGVYRSTDGGRSWKQVLYVNETTGASDLAFDPQNPNVLYAGMFDYLRQPWHLRSGGPGSGLYRSSDGGDTWVRLNDPALDNGLPTDTLGRVGVRVSRSDPRVVYAIIQSRQGLLWRSADSGAHWTMVDRDPNIDWRPFYFSNIRIDPSNPNRVYALSRALMISTDGGKGFHPVPYARLFGDCHALWIDPSNPHRLLSGSDGGLFVSNDAGRHWGFLDNMPFAQVYHMAVDTALPYHVLGGFQDHEVWRGPSTRWNDVGTKGGDWRRICPFGDGSFVAVDPRNPNLIYYDTQDNITRFDMSTHEQRRISPYPVATAGASAGAMKYRFNWNAPLLLSPDNPNVLYYGGNVLFKTSDEGATWQVISPDLTTNNPAEEGLSGGPVGYDNTTAEFHCTITAIAQSPFDPDLLWVGTDDGNLEITRDGGKHWSNVVGNLRGLPRESWVSSVNTSHLRPGTAFVSFDRHQMDDFGSYAYVTQDYGKTWTSLSSGLRGYVNVIRQDPFQPNLIYAGTELGIFVSFDRGKNWTDLRLGLPPLPVDDLRVERRFHDLIIATHARGFYILDDATALEQFAARRGQQAALFPPVPAYRYLPWSDTSTVGGQVWLAPNKPYGSILSYYLHSPGREGQPVRLEILDSAGQVIRHLKGPSAQGINRVVWNLREDPLVGIVPDPQKAWRTPRLPAVLALPGVYTVRLEAAGESVSQKLEILMNPRVRATPADLVAYGQAVRRLDRMDYQIAESLERIRRIDDHLAALGERVSDPDVLNRAKAVEAQLSAVRDDLAPPRLSPQHLNLRARVGRLTAQVAGFTGRPTAAQEKYLKIFARQLLEVQGRLRSVIQGQLGALNARLAAAHVPYISPEDELAPQEATDGKENH